MTLRNQKRLLRAAMIGLLAAGAGALAWGWTPPPLETPAPPSAPRMAQRKRAPSRAKEPSAAPRFEGNWSRPLRRPLYDPPPPPPPVVEKPPPRPITTKLLATMIESDQGVAMLQLANGEVIFRKTGEGLAGEDHDATIVEIVAGSISVRRGEDVSRLAVEGTASN